MIVLRHRRGDLPGSLDGCVVVASGQLPDDQVELGGVGLTQLGPVRIRPDEKRLDPLFQLLSGLDLGRADGLGVAIPERLGDHDRSALLVLTDGWSAITVAAGSSCASG